MPQRPKTHRPKQTAPTHQARRPTANQRGYNSKWQKVSKAYLRAHPVCAECGEMATCVDHIQAHKGDMGLFWDSDNWQSMCPVCHNRKTARHDGGFGRPVGLPDAYETPLRGS